MYISFIYCDRTTIRYLYSNDRSPRGVFPVISLMSYPIQVFSVKKLNA